MVSLGAIACFLVVTLATSIYIASIPGIMAEFSVGRTLAILPVTLYALGFAVGPMCTSALSEEFGRQYVYKVSLLLHFAFTLGGGFAQNYQTVAVCRALSGVAGSPSVSVFAGVLNDLWAMPGDRLGVPLFVLYGLGGAAAPEIGPVIGEAVVAVHGWRSSFWLTAILVGMCFLGMVFVPETYEPEILRKQLQSHRRNPRQALGEAFWRPIQLIRSEPIVLPTAMIVTMSQIVIFILYAGFPVVLGRTYRFSPYQVGLAFLPFLIGTMLAAPVLIMVDKRKRRLDRPVPEDNLPGAMLAAILLPISLLWLGWTTHSSIHWVCPLLAGVPYGLGFALSQLAYPLYKNEVYGAKLGASTLAVDVAMRYLFSSVFPLFTDSLIDGIGFEWTMTACAIFFILLAPVPWLLQKFGAALRDRSQYARQVSTETQRGQQPKKDRDGWSDPSTLHAPV
ncbi:unnamed protein product [Penicillium olsonii]|uniref:Major facilitator superfamily (MFS) profile domain-containing protein n=1 Tax=Penicillium olsonii TaxID=99116 RepID=A0A9W4I3P4_PENOL|nr:unnamed protein product [Penicillium olsonii]